MDLHALGVFYKIKRLKQKLLVIERLSGKQESGEDGKTEGHGQFGEEGFPALMSLLNRHLSRYQSLQERTDDICKRMVSSYLENPASPISKIFAVHRFLNQFIDSMHPKNYLPMFQMGGYWFF